MSRWHVWGDYLHTLPDAIGGAGIVRRDDPAARRSAEAAGFDLRRRIQNGFESWAASFCSDGDETEIAFAFASYPIVRGWRKVGSA